MKILALDSSGLVASVAVVSDDNLIGEYTINYKKAKGLAMALDKQSFCTYRRCACIQSVGQCRCCVSAYGCKKTADLYRAV